MFRHTERSEDNPGCSSLPSTLFETPCFTTAYVRVTNWHMGSQDFSCLYFPSCWDDGSALLHLALQGFWDPELRSSCLFGKCLINWTISQIQKWFLTGIKVNKNKMSNRTSAGSNMRTNAITAVLPRTRRELECLCVRYPVLPPLGKMIVWSHGAPECCAP